jgi:hypothetical protein
MASLTSRLEARVVVADRNRGECVDLPYAALRRNVAGSSSGIYLMLTAKAFRSGRSQEQGALNCRKVSDSGGFGGEEGAVGTKTNRHYNTELGQILGLKEPWFSQSIEIMSEQCQSVVELRGFEAPTSAVQAPRALPGPPTIRRRCQYVERLAGLDENSGLNGP